MAHQSLLGIILCRLVYEFGYDKIQFLLEEKGFHNKREKRNHVIRIISTSLPPQWMKFIINKQTSKQMKVIGQLFT